jgi:hypothetical protein
LKAGLDGDGELEQLEELLRLERLRQVQGLRVEHPPERIWLL